MFSLDRYRSASLQVRIDGHGVRTQRSFSTKTPHMMELQELRALLTNDHAEHSDARSVENDSMAPTMSSVSSLKAVLRIRSVADSFTDSLRCHSRAVLVGPILQFLSVQLLKKDAAASHTRSCTNSKTCLTWRTATISMIDPTFDEGAGFSDVEAFRMEQSYLSAVHQADILSCSPLSCHLSYRMVSFKHCAHHQCASWSS